MMCALGDFSLKVRELFCGYAHMKVGLGGISIFEIYQYFVRRDMERDSIVNINIVNLS